MKRYKRQFASSDMPLVKVFEKPSLDSKPMARMWFPDAAAGTDENDCIDRQLRTMAEGGMPPMFGAPKPKLPIEKGPFYALRLGLFHENAVGGMTIDENASVLKNGKPIPGLYAAGDTTRGIMIPGDVGVGYIEGVFTALTQALNEGYIAGVEATKHTA